MIPHEQDGGSFSLGFLPSKFHYLISGTKKYCQLISFSMNYAIKILAICRGHTHLLRRKPHCDWRKGHGGYLRHLSRSLPFPDGWVHWPGSTYRQNQDLFPHICDGAASPSQFDPCHVCVLGVWHSHAAALPAGSGRPEEQTCPCGQWANHGGTPGVGHWDLAGQQQRLRHQPHQRHWTEDLHRHSRLGSRRLQVCRRNVCHSIVFIMSSFFIDSYLDIFRRSFRLLHFWRRRTKEKQI